MVPQRDALNDAVIRQKRLLSFDSVLDIYQNLEIVEKTEAFE